MPVSVQNIFTRCGVGSAVVEIQGAGILHCLVHVLVAAMSQLFFFPAVKSEKNHSGPVCRSLGKVARPASIIPFYIYHTKYNSSPETVLGLFSIPLHKFVDPKTTVNPCKGIMPFKPGI